MKLNDLLNARFTKFDRHTQINILHAVFALQPCADREDAFLIANDGLDHLRSSSSWRIPGRCAEQFDDLSTTHLGALDNGLEFFFIDHLCHGDTTNSRVAWQWHHGVSVSAHENSLNVLWRHIELCSKECAITRCIQDTRHAKNTVRIDLGCQECRVGHDIQWIRHDNNDGIR